MPAQKEPSARLAAAEKENAEIKRHLKPLLDEYRILVAAWRRVETLEWAVSGAGAFLIAARHG